MDVRCTVHCNGYHVPDETDGNKRIYIESDTGYNNIVVGIEEYKNGQWVLLGKASADGPTMIKAINNGLNS